MLKEIEIIKILEDNKLLLKTYEKWIKENNKFNYDNENLYNDINSLKNQIQLLERILNN